MIDSAPPSVCSEPPTTIAGGVNFGSLTEDDDEEDPAPAGLAGRSPRDAVVTTGKIVDCVACAAGITIAVVCTVGGTSCVDTILTGMTVGFTIIVVGLTIVVWIGVICPGNSVGMALVLDELVDSAAGVAVTGSESVVGFTGARVVEGNGCVGGSLASAIVATGVGSCAFELDTEVCGAWTVGGAGIVVGTRVIEGVGWVGVVITGVGVGLG